MKDTLEPRAGVLASAPAKTDYIETLGQRIASQAAFTLYYAFKNLSSLWRL